MYVCLYTFILMIAEVDVIKIKILLPIKQTNIIIIIKTISEYHFHRTIFMLEQSILQFGGYCGTCKQCEAIGIKFA